MLTPAEKIYFWSGIMRDHGEFFIMSLSYRESEYIKKAIFFKNSFITLRSEAKSLIDMPSPEGTLSLTNRAMDLLNNFVNFKKSAIRKLLNCDIELGLPPSFINHMINEAMEFHRDLTKSNAPINPVVENIMLHKIWLPDASGHAASIAGDLDPTETSLIKEANYFEKIFNNLFIKSVELGQMLERTNLENGSLRRLNTEVKNKINAFISFLEKVGKLRKECKALGILDPLIPNHMIREEKYYLENIKSLER